MIRKLNHAGMALFVFLCLSAFILWKTGYLKFGSAAAGPAGIEVFHEYGEHEEAAHGNEDAEAGHAGETHAEEGHDEHGHGDLDVGTMPLEEIAAQECEHDVAAVDCNNCRFEMGVVKLQPLLAKALVSTGSLLERSAAQAVRVTGEIELDPNRVVEVPPIAAGRVLDVRAVLGEKVDRGDVLAVIHSSDFGEAKATFLEAKAELELARSTLDREKELYDKQISAEADYLQARKEAQAAEAKVAAAEKRLHLFGLTQPQVEAINAQKDNGEFSHLIVRAPRSGRIVEQNVSEGKVVDGSQSLYTIADLTNLWLWCDVFERDLAAIYDGLDEANTLESSLQVAAFPQQRFVGHLDLVGNEIDKHTRTIRMRVRVDNPDERLRPGMFANAEILIPGEGTCPVLPREAVLSDEGTNFVFQHWKDDLWVRRDVAVGREFGPYVEVLDGVPRDARIVTAGAFMLKSDVLRGKMGAGCAD